MRSRAITCAPNFPKARVFEGYREQPVAARIDGAGSVSSGLVLYCRQPRLRQAHRRLRELYDFGDDCGSVHLEAGRHSRNFTSFLHCMRCLRRQSAQGKTVHFRAARSLALIHTRCWRDEGLADSWIGWSGLNSFFIGSLTG